MGELSPFKCLLGPFKYKFSDILYLSVDMVLSFSHANKIIKLCSTLSRYMIYVLCNENLFCCCYILLLSAPLSNNLMHQDMLGVEQGCLERDEKKGSGVPGEHQSSHPPAMSSFSISCQQPPGLH